ncbi:tRNA dihydrouridine synthase DusB [Candidatus Viridilinea mediisalina]|uniref:tRNA-dihydrouridine synthase n=1 Tax=Candidatus Viridilinea mediisalina TaxID=2024553 RepID=A0A2A6RGD8_9CHLR|nr:tRNA dihydrouridine synthase DusB [Candidatus Viridilinea mediisalina]PDW01945.1 tRNA dihydrouridine synthase DusB [Candidatus Viridilinea mediisalina]
MLNQAEIERLPSAYAVAHIQIAPNIILAPMAGVTDSIFRRMILRMGGCGLVSTEMTNAASVSPKALRRHGLLDFYPEERPLTMQLSGNDPDLVANAAHMVEQLGADIIDINCGCPSPKVTGGGHGASLLRDLPKMGRVLRAVRAAVQVPLTLKFRAGWDEQQLNYLDTAKLAEDCGVAALALHPRTREQRYTGQADWSRVAAVKRAVAIPVIGSGDVQNCHDALVRLRDSGADGVMIGRAAMANPWIFMQIADLRAGVTPFQPSPADKLDFLLRYMAMCEEELPARLALNKTKQLIGQFVVALPGASHLRVAVHRSQTLDQAREQIIAYFSHFATALCAQI